MTRRSSTSRMIGLPSGSGAKMESALSRFGLGAGVKERAQPVACTAVQAVHAADCALCRSPLSGVSVYSVVP